MRLVLRTEINKGVGLGHFRRSLSIAKAFQLNCGQVAFICDNHPYAQKMLSDFQIEYIPREDVFGSKRDLESLYECLDRNSFCLIDSYKLNPEIADALSEEEVPFCYMDDTGQSFSAAKAVINGNFLGETFKYNSSIQGRFLGASYFPLFPSFWSQNQLDNESIETRSVTISLGGTDEFDLTEIVYKVLRDFFPGLEIHAVVGPFFSDQQKENLSRIQDDLLNLYFSPDDLSPIFKKSTSSIVSGGQTVYESLACRIPTLAIKMAENQSSIISYVKDQNAALTLAYDKTLLFEESLKKAVYTLVTEHEKRHLLKENAARIVDTGSAIRLAKELNQFFERIL